MTGGISGKDRPSAVNRTPRLFVAHQHYAMLYRLATRPAPAKTRVELEIHNEFLPGPVAVNNTIGEIRGTDKADEVVVVGAHLDSWDLGQGATDNGTGSIVALETARALVKSGLKPRRTIRFILFTGEEQGLLGSKAYVEKHKDEMPKISACLVDDTGTGKIVGFDAKHRPVLQPLLEKELASLKDLGVTAFDTPFIGGSDHASFDKAGVPGLMARQEIAGYRLNHHSPARHPGPRHRAEPDPGGAGDGGDRPAHRRPRRPAASRQARSQSRPIRRRRRRNRRRRTLARFSPDDLGKLVGVSDPRISPDGKSIVIVVGRPNYDENRTDTELVLVDIATGKQRVLTHDRHGVTQPRWSPSGDRLAFLAAAGDIEGSPASGIRPADGRRRRRCAITDSPTGVLQYAWKPDGSAHRLRRPGRAGEQERDRERRRRLRGRQQRFHGPGRPAAGARLARRRRRRQGAAADFGIVGPGDGAAARPAGVAACRGRPTASRSRSSARRRPHDGDNDLTTVQVLDVETGKIGP